MCINDDDAAAAAAARVINDFAKSCRRYLPAGGVGGSINRQAIK